MALLSVEHVSKSFISGWIKKEEKKILHDISFVIEKGETLGLTGVSGAGKSTISRIIMGLTRCDEGKIYFREQELSSLGGMELIAARKKMQMLFQNPLASLNPRMTIGESMREPALIHGHSIPSDEEIFSVMERLKLRKELVKRYPYQLSGGEVQRVCLGRLLLLKPELLILDEPTSMLDVSVQAQIVDILEEIQEEDHISYLFISHDLDLLRYCSHRIGVLKAGRMMELQDTKKLYATPMCEYTKELIGAFQSF